MTPWMRRLHKWIGLLIAIQFLLWMVSGLGMSWLDHERVQGKRWLATSTAAQDWPADAFAIDRVLAASPRPVTAIASAWLDGRPVYEIADEGGTRLVDAGSGESIVVDAGLARRVAIASYTGPGSAGTPVYSGPTLETRIHAGDVWRVDFDDDEGTTVYVAADTGRVIVHRNAAWRLFDVFWMLHIMDYAGRADFNNPLVVMAGVGGLWMALSGLWLLVASYRLAEFLPRRFRGGGRLAVHGANGSLLRTLPATSGDNTYVALARHGLHLPSNCGGGQSCGLCEVRVRGNAPAATAADRAHIPDSRLRMGYRLACNLPLQGELQIEVPGGAELWAESGATVEQATSPTPFLREIVLRPDHPVDDANYRPGSYLQLHVPAYALPRERIIIADRHARAWQGITLPATLHNDAPVRRAYSLALAPSACAGRLHLLVRFMPGKDRRHLPGKGSAWVHTLAAGDRVTFSGPFGDFALEPGEREKVFIGGGAGMGPLRAMIRARLAAGGTERIHFWYGARSAGEIPYAEEMEALVRAHPNFSWHPILSGQAGQDTIPGDARMVHDAVQEDLLASHASPATCGFYLCGPPAMLAATRRLLAQLGVPDERIAFDDFKI